MEIELAHSLNIKLSNEVFHKISKVQKRLTDKFTERRAYDPSPHLSVLLKFAHPSETRNFTERLVAEFQNENCWDFEFARYSISTNGEYIFLNPTESTREKLFGIHERAIGATHDIGSLGQGGAPAKHAFDPHISLIKLLPEESHVALGMLRNEMDGERFHVSAYTVTVDDENTVGSIRTVQELPLID